MNISNLLNYEVFNIVFTNFVGSTISCLIITFSFYYIDDNINSLNKTLGISFIGSFIGGTIGFLVGASSGSVGAVIAGLFGVVSVIAAYLFGKDRTKDAIMLICSISAFFLSMLIMTAAGHNSKAAAERQLYCMEIMLEHIDDQNRINTFEAYCKDTW